VPPPHCLGLLELSWGIFNNEQLPFRASTYLCSVIQGSFISEDLMLIEAEEEAMLDGGGSSEEAFLL
jgi:hypothetical protein